MRTLDCSDSTPLGDKTAADTDTNAINPDVTDTGNTIGVLLTLIIGTDSAAAVTIGATVTTILQSFIGENHGLLAQHEFEIGTTKYQHCKFIHMSFR